MTVKDRLNLTAIVALRERGLIGFFSRLTKDKLYMHIADACASTRDQGP